MARTVYGTITNSNNGAPIQGALVEAWDSDWPDADDFMGSALTDASGKYSISHSGGHWDPSPHHNITTWRPDIYIRVYMQNGVGAWVKVKESTVHSNHKLRNNLHINTSVSPPNPHARTVWGKITWKGTKNPAVGVWVRALDSDFSLTSGQAKGVHGGAKFILNFGFVGEFMGGVLTDQNGDYVIPYEGKHWDPKLFWGSTNWRPDIYIAVSGQAADGNWYQLHKSDIHSNVPHREGVHINAAVKSIPEAVSDYEAETNAESSMWRKFADGTFDEEGARQESRKALVKKELESNSAARRQLSHEPMKSQS